MKNESFVTQSIGELVKMWKVFEEQTKEKRRVVNLEEEDTFLKAQFSDFIDWLSENNEKLTPQV